MDPHEVPLVPEGPGQGPRNSGVSAAVWWDEGAKKGTKGIPDPWHAPIPQTAQAGPEGLGCVCRRVEKLELQAHLALPRATLSPKA